MEARHQTFRIQREEEDAWLSVLDNVRAYIKFSKSGDTGDRRKSTWSYVLHDERNHANVGFTFEEIDFQSIRKVRLESISIDLEVNDNKFPQKVGPVSIKRVPLYPDCKLQEAFIVQASL